MFIISQILQKCYNMLLNAISWHDPKIEINAYRELLKKPRFLDRPPELLFCEGVDTIILFLLRNNIYSKLEKNGGRILNHNGRRISFSFDRITCCSSGSTKQIGLIDIKIALFFFFLYVPEFDNLELIHRINMFLCLMNGDVQYSDVENIMQAIQDQIKYPKFWKTETGLQILTKGLHNIDAFSHLFDLTKKGTDFQNAFSYHRIIECFGKRMAYQGLRQKFSTHFSKVYHSHLNKKIISNDLTNNNKKRIVIYEKCLKCQHNYFFVNRIKKPKENIIAKIDLSNIEEMPEFLKYILQFKTYKEFIRFHRFKKLQNYDKVKYVNNNIITYLENTGRRFNLIHLGSFTDILHKDEIDDFMRLIKEHCRKHSRIIFRRINSDYELYPFVNKYFMVLNIDRDLHDATHFYREVILASPRISVEDRR